VSADDIGAEDGWPSGEGRKGWRAADLDLEAISHRWTEAELAKLLECVAAVRDAGTPAEAIRREDFDALALRGRLAALSRQLKYGPGLLFLRNFPVDKLSREDLWRLYAGVAAHFGIAVSQNLAGQRLGEVTVRSGGTGDRVYGSAVAAPLHTDRIDVLALLCVRRAIAGGENEFVSGLAVWDLVARERPDLCAILERGFPQWRNGEQPPGEPDATPFRVPVFGRAGALRSVMFSGNAMLKHQQRHFGDALTEPEAEALRYVRAVAERPELRLRVSMQPGDAVFVDNYEVLHSREAFVDAEVPEQRRLLLRLWLQGRPWRPKPETMQVIRNPSGLQGIDPAIAGGSRSSAL
jgi:alpha-ketoglutarate-dependent taurine dioxygenase